MGGRSPPRSRGYNCQQTGTKLNEIHYLTFKSSGIHRKVGSVGSIPMHLRHSPPICGKIAIVQIFGQI